MAIWGLLIVGLLVSSCRPVALESQRREESPDSSAARREPSSKGAPDSSPIARNVLVTHPRELRGVWVASVFNTNWPTDRSLSPHEQRSELVRILDTAQVMGLNAVYLQVRPESDALYLSELEPWSDWLTGTQGKAPEPLYDPLEFAVTEAHKRGLELHAWINPFRGRSTTASTSSPRHITQTLKTYARVYGDQVIMDPGAAAVQEHILRVLRDLASRYDIDGIHMDDYFYPYPKAGETFRDNDLFAAYRQGGGTLDLGAWRRDNVNRFVRQAGEMLRELKPHLSYGLSPFGIYRPGEPPGTEGALDQYGSMYADPKKWMQEEWLDYIIPQLYWPTHHDKFGFVKLLDWWLEVNTRSIPVYAGSNITKLGQSGWDVGEFRSEVAAVRTRRSRQALGQVFYNIGHFVTDKQGVKSTFASEIFSLPALPPVHRRAPEAKEFPGKVYVNERQIRWSVPAKWDARGVTIYQKSQGAWILQHRQAGFEGNLILSAGEWAVAAVDAWAVESLAIVLKVL